MRSEHSSRPTHPSPPFGSFQRIPALLQAVAMPVGRACNEASRFLQTCFGCDDWTALLLKDRNASKAVQQIGSLPWACSDQVQEWLLERNTTRHDVYASVN